MLRSIHQAHVLGHINAGVQPPWGCEAKWPVSNSSSTKQTLLTQTPTAPWGLIERLARRARPRPVLARMPTGYRLPRGCRHGASPAQTAKPPRTDTYAPRAQGTRSPSTCGSWPIPSEPIMLDKSYRLSSFRKGCAQKAGCYRNAGGVPNATDPTRAAAPSEAAFPARAAVPTRAATPTRAVAPWARTSTFKRLPLEAEA